MFNPRPNFFKKQRSKHFNSSHSLANSKMDVFLNKKRIFVLHTLLFQKDLDNKLFDRRGTLQSLLTKKYHMLTIAPQTTSLVADGNVLSHVFL
tara:strand:+ start:623 stop:901 length:279 start_codon:yes stop_codon:yes gene_type:complete